MATEADTAELQTKAALFASAPLLALVNSQITPDEIPEETKITPDEDAPVTYPAISYERVGSDPEHTLDSVLRASRVSIEIQIWGTSRSACNQVAALVTAAMHEAGHAETDRKSAFETELRQHAAILTFDVWEIPIISE